jgi:hypothetical protein
MAPFSDSYGCNTVGGGWFGCRNCYRGWYCDRAEDRRRAAACAFGRALTATVAPRDGWWSDFDRIPGWSIVLKPDAWVHAARRVIHQMVSAAVRRRRKRRAFVHALRAAG